MKILMTGMASAHCSTKGNTTFFSGLYQALSEFAEVTICEPKISWTRSDLEKYDSVVVGLTPPTSLAANNIYGALHLIDMLYESPRLRLVVDGPQVWQFKNSFASFLRKPLQITDRMFYSRRYYSEASTEYQRSFTSLADKMSSIQWPITYVPLLPWKSLTDTVSATGFLDLGRVVGVNVDSFLLTSSEPDASGVKNQTWAVDNAKSQWWSKLSRTLRWSGEPASKSRKPKDSDVEAVISSASGLIVTPQDRKVGTWWNYRYIQGLNLGTPIVTDWQDTHSFSSSWSKLAYQIEDMDPYDRYALARRQLSEYTNAVPTRWDSSSALRNDLLESNKERANYARD